MSTQHPVITQAIVIGMGEVGARIKKALTASGVDVVPVTRETNWDIAENDPSAPRIICVREEALQGVLNRLKAIPSRLIVAVPNGWIKPDLEHFEDATRGLIWFTSKGDFFRQLRPSPFSGPLAEILVPALARGGLSVQALNAADFDRADADKMGFNCVVGLPLAVHRVSLGAYLKDHRDEAEALFSESVTVCAAAAGAEIDSEWWPQFLESVAELDWVATSKAKALDYRNGAVVRLGREFGIPTPVNDRLLKNA